MIRAQVKELKGAPVDQIVRVCPLYDFVLRSASRSAAEMRRADSQVEVKKKKEPEPTP